MAIDLQSLSITSAFNSIVNYFRSQENNSAWRSLTTGSEGSFLIRLLANVISVLSYRIVAQSRENYLSTASLASSNIGIAVNLGYSVFRGSNLKRLVYLTPSRSFTLPKFSVLGAYNDEYNIITLEDVKLVEGVKTKINTVVGNVKEESFTAGTSSIRIFSLFTTGISEDYMLFRDNLEVPTTNVMKDMINDKYLVRTNPYSSVDIAYLNTFETASYKYGTGSEITIRYVELADVPVIPYNNSMFLYGTLDNYVTTSTYLPLEPVDSIKITAPLDHETQNLIRSKVDYANRIQQIIPAITEANYEALTPTYTLITYLKDNFTLLSGTLQKVGTSQENKEALYGTEVEKVTNILKEENFFGTPLPDITIPRREVAYIDVAVALKNKYKSISDINLDISNILRNYYNAYLNVTFSVYDLERQIENLSYVKYARVSFKLNERKPNTNYQLGYLSYKDEKNKDGDKVRRYYKVSKILGRTSPSQPDGSWRVPLSAGTEIDTQAVILDGSIYWKCFKKLPGMSKYVYSKRASNAQYGIGDYVYTDLYPDYMFKCIDIVKQTGGAVPSLTTAELGDFIVDGGIVWVVKDKVTDDGTRTWEAMSSFRLGETANVPGADVSLECISYTGTTSTEEELSLAQSSYDIEQQDANNFYILGDRTYQFRAGDSIEALDDEGYTAFVVEDSIYRNGVTEITVTRFQNDGDSAIPAGRNYTTIFATPRGTQDEGILWTLVDDIDRVTYDWNSYVTFEHDLTILE